MSPQIPTRPDVSRSAGFHFPMPVNGTFEVTSRDMSSIAAEAVLRLFWEQLQEAWATSSEASPLFLVAHRHGQKEPVDADCSPGRASYCMQANETFQWESVVWLSAAVGGTRRPTSTDPTSCAPREGVDPEEVMLSGQSTSFYLAGMLRFKNLQTSGQPPLRLSRQGESVLERLRHSVPCEDVGLVRSTLYSEMIHLVRAGGNPTHHFDYHR